MIKQAGFIIADGTAIYSSAETLESAVEAFERDTGYDAGEGGEVSEYHSGDCRLHWAPATKNLLDQVEAEGGCITWHYIGRIACTVQEREQRS